MIIQRMFSNTSSLGVVEESDKDRNRKAARLVGLTGVGASVTGGLIAGKRKTKTNIAKAEISHSNRIAAADKALSASANEITRDFNTDFSKLKEEFNKAGALKGKKKARAKANYDAIYNDLLEAQNRRVNKSVEKYNQDLSNSANILEQDILKAKKLGKKTRNRIIAGGLLATGATIGGIKAYRHIKNKKKEE